MLLKRGLAIAIPNYPIKFQKPGGKMSIKYQSTLLSFGLLLTLISGSAMENKTSNFALALESNQSVKLAQVGQAKQNNQKPSAGVKQTQNRVKVFLPKNPKNNQNPSYVEPVLRTTQRGDVLKYSIEQVIAGPTSNEIKQGFLKPIQLRGSSNCGSDFTVSLSGSVARLKFCKTVISGGIGSDARAKGSLESTLKQFSTVKSVVILTNTGDCLGDQSGENFCLRGGRK
ncbi:GerMN domain-containing protein [Microcoleus sp. FACHB-831]|uniref:GerMN domain-containing protein n=1 Tax=Microcoleus sp. FACHB-831 TaxID=2692827 RepID=UPI001686FF90|nr:GerMN domain-containing protein [Microcoleus sp. FACHB-831]MBD1923825.1 GerMN domain-containing protein [Microcoleus sp. FACHB-831]